MMASKAWPQPPEYSSLNTTAPNIYEAQAPTRNIVNIHMLCFQLLCKCRREGRRGNARGIRRFRSLGICLGSTHTDKATDSSLLKSR